jgi:hypothetical protein
MVETKWDIVEHVILGHSQCYYRVKVCFRCSDGLSGASLAESLVFDESSRWKLDPFYSGQWILCVEDSILRHALLLIFKTIVNYSLCTSGVEGCMRRY